MKSNLCGDQAQWSDDIATLFGSSTAFRSGIHSGAYHSCRPSGSKVRFYYRSSTTVLTRVSVNGTHLAADATSFLEKRRRGLVRFANALVQHPVLNQEQLVVMFLTVPTVSGLLSEAEAVHRQD